MKIFLLLIVAVIIIPNVVGWARRRRLGTERNSKIGNLTKLVSTTAVPLWEETDVLTKLLQELDEKVMDAEVFLSLFIWLLCVSLKFN